MQFLIKENSYSTPAACTAEISEVEPSPPSPSKKAYKAHCHEVTATPVCRLSKQDPSFTQLAQKCQPGLGVKVDSLFLMHIIRSRDDARINSLSTLIQCHQARIGLTWFQHSLCTHNTQESDSCSRTFPLICSPVTHV